MISGTSPPTPPLAGDIDGVCDPPLLARAPSGPAQPAAVALPYNFSSTPLALIDARGNAPWQTVGGLSLVMRLVRSLELEGVQRITVLSDRPAGPEDLGSRNPATEITVERPETPRHTALGAVAPVDGILAVEGTLVVDRRILRALLRVEAPTEVWPIPGAPVGNRKMRIARLAAEDLGRFFAPPHRMQGLAQLDPRELPTYAEEMRGDTPILLHDASTPAAARDAEAALVRDTQKHVMDAPARWIDPHIENALVRWLAPTRITPNQVTLAGTVIGFVAAWWLWKGRLELALPAMFLVGWLDGVDGKLARLRLHYSRLGRAEAYFDFAYENAWWVALTAFLSGAGHGEAAVWAGAALIAGNLLDEIAYTLSGAWLGTSLDLLSPADGAFRLVAGRRNIYVVIISAATLAGSAYAGLVICGAWAIVTSIAHTMRLGFAVRARQIVERQR